MREWARNHNIKSTYKSGAKILLWTDSDIEKYVNAPHYHVGNSGYKFTPEQKAHLSEIRKGIKQSEETKKKRSESMKAAWTRKKALNV